MIKPPENLEEKSAETMRPLAAHMKSLYPQGITDLEAHKAADNLVRFCKILLEIEKERVQNQSHDQ